MALYKYFKKEDPAALPTVATCGSSSFTQKEIQHVNKVVKRTLDEDSSKTVKKKGKYNSYSPEDRARIGKYATENGPTKAAAHFSKVLDCKINESTARKFKSEYLNEIKKMVHDDVDDYRYDGKLVVSALPTKPQGRPLLLGKELDQAVQDYVKALRIEGGVVNTSIVMAACEGIVTAKDASKLSSHGGHIHVTKTWAKSLLGRMGYVKRKGSNAGKVSMLHFEEIKEAFLADVTAEVVMNDVPDDLVFNWDQTVLHLVPTGQWTMHQAGEKLIPIANSDDKRQITAVLAASMTGEYLPPQLIYQGKTNRCHPQVPIPEGWDIWHSDNHWSNEETMKRYIEKIVIPFITQKREALELSNSHPALVLFDAFRGQTTSDIKQLLDENNIISVLIPPNCTDKLQPMDIAINKPMKDELKTRFQTWYANEVQKQLLKHIPLEQVKVDVTATAIKHKSANWIFSSWQAIEQRPEIAINGFKKAGLVDAIASVQD